MTNLFTEVKISKSATCITYRSKIMFVGSCFADNIYTMFNNAKFNCLSNPLGTLYNPLSISILFDLLLGNKTITENDFFYYQNQYSSYLMHGSCSDTDLKRAIEKSNNSISNARNYLKDCDILFITLGTAFVYYLNQNNQPVANCHKQNPKLFTRRMLTVEQSAQALVNICQNVKQFNPNINIVFTVSPIRHIADGAIDNTLSKSTLLLSINKTINTLANVEYFPSYEIMLDELRDYRFYDETLTHPSKLAQEIIFDKLLSTFCSQTVINQITTVGNYIKSANHKIISPFSPETKLFAENQLQRAMQLESQIDGLNLNNEKQYFNDIIIKNKTHNNE